MPKQKFQCDYCKIDYISQELAVACEEGDIRFKTVTGVAHHNFLKDHKDLLWGLSIFLQKFKTDNGLSLIPIPITIETNSHGFLVKFDPEDKFDQSDLPKAKEYIKWMQLFRLITQKSLNVEGNNALVDRFYIRTMIQTMNEVFGEDSVAKEVHQDMKGVYHAVAHSFGKTVSIESYGSGLLLTVDYLTRNGKGLRVYITKQKNQFIISDGGLVEMGYYCHEKQPYKFQSKEDLREFMIRAGFKIVFVESGDKSDCNYYTTANPLDICQKISSFVAELWAILEHTGNTFNLAEKDDR